MSGQFNITAIDVSILLGWLILTRIVALLLTGKNEDSADYFLAGRSLRWPAIGFSLFATNVSAATFVGLAGSGYAQGVSVSAYEWMAAIIAVFFLIFILPLYLKSKVYTLPEFLGRRYDRRTRLAFAGFNLLVILIVGMSGALYAGGLIIQTLFPAIPLWLAIAGLTLVSAGYTVTGGLKAVVVTDTIQAIVVILGALVVLGFSLSLLPSWDATQQLIPEGHKHIIQPITDSDLPWPGIITGVLIVGAFTWVGDQSFTQRTLGARSINDARLGAIFAGFLKVSQLFIFILPGVFALVLFPNLDSADLAFPTLAFSILPEGFRGLLLAAVVAAITSTVDSSLNSASSLVTMDFARSFRANLNERQLLRIGRTTTVIFSIFAILWAPRIASFPTLYSYIQSSLSYLTPPIVATFLMGIFWTKTSRMAAFWTLCTLIPIGLVGFILTEIIQIFSLQFLYVAGGSFVLSLLALVVISLGTESPSAPEVRALTWRPALWRNDSAELKTTPLLLNYRFWSVVLVIVTFVVVFAFR